jgi:hypothetical protein
MDGIVKLQQKIKRDAKEGVRSAPVVVESQPESASEGDPGESDD